METLIRSFRSVLVAVVLIGCLAAQHLKADASFDSGVTASFSLTNFDNSNSGSGNIFKYNGQAVNWYIEWTRNGTEVTITYQGVLNSTLHDAGQGSNGGTANINDGQNTPGTWTRT